ncbi:sulfatase-like hydrolase/transferase [Candidatus Bathyarchaeota archaeon]|nr:sulfatase-like hydrolase/transferase [Candidatus Bathyarchaeota archaeon]
MNATQVSTSRPNIIFIMSDDHASHAISAYTKPDPMRPVINETPNIDRIADGGMRFENCFCTNSICTPSRAVILTGKYSHHPLNNVKTFLPMDNSLPTVAKDLQAAGYQTAMIGKWHLGTGPTHCPTGFDYWKVLPGQGAYHNPVFIEMDAGIPGGRRVKEDGYVTDLITDDALEWLEHRDMSKPFFLMVHHKAPHRPWKPDEKHADMYDDVDIPIPSTFDDDYTSSRARRNARMRIDRDFDSEDVKVLPPIGVGFKERLKVPDESELDDYALEPYDPLDEGREFDQVTFSSLEERKRWLYQRYIKDYLRVIASIDDNVGRLLDYLDREGLAGNTIVMYTSDQGFFLGDHGWYDKRFMYEESLRMPLLVRYPAEVEPGTVNSDLVLNLDFAPTWLDLAGEAVPVEMQGTSFRAILQGNTPPSWRTSMYYRYWLDRDGAHDTTAHYGIRTVGPTRKAMKLIYYYADPLGIADAGRGPVFLPEGEKVLEHVKEWECFDLNEDPYEMDNIYLDPERTSEIENLKQEMHELQEMFGDDRYHDEV